MYPASKWYGQEMGVAKEKVGVIKKWFGHGHGQNRNVNVTVWNRNMALNVTVWNWNMALK